MKQDKEKKSGQTADKKKIDRFSFGVKKKIIDEVTNGRISINHASVKYQVSRSAIDYWLKKFATFEQKINRMSSKDEIKKLKDRIEELEFIKDFQQELIANFETETGKELSKKYLPEHLVKEIEKKKRHLKKD
ncbi:MAG: hypothetical protein PHD97_11360 [Bacteroidales bacterium]|nr:hypothetical protein [Bacteroidales bacterium]